MKILLSVTVVSDVIFDKVIADIYCTALTNPPLWLSVALCICYVAQQEVFDSVDSAEVSSRAFRVSVIAETPTWTSFMVWVRANICFYAFSEYCIGKHLSFFAYYFIYINVLLYSSDVFYFKY